MKWVELEQSQFHLAKIQSMLVDWMTLVYLADWPWTSSEVVFSYFQFWWLKNDLITEVTSMSLNMLAWNLLHSSTLCITHEAHNKVLLNSVIFAVCNSETTHFLLSTFHSFTVQTTIYWKEKIAQTFAKYLQCANFSWDSL